MEQKLYLGFAGKKDSSLGPLMQAINPVGGAGREAARASPPAIRRLTPWRGHLDSAASIN
jgi:hypothetical protein